MAQPIIFLTLSPISWKSSKHRFFVKAYVSVLERGSLMGKSVDKALISRLGKTQILDLAKRALTSVVSYFFLFIFIAVVTPMRGEHPGVLWTAGVVIFMLSAVRLVLAARLPVIYDRAPERWRGVFIGMTLFSGLFWGVFGLLVGIFYPLEWPFFFVLVIICGLTAGATSSLAPHQGLSRDFSMGMLLPISIWALFQGTSLGVGVGVLSLFSMAMFIRMAKDNYLWYWEALASNEKIAGQGETMARIFEGVQSNAGELNQTAGTLAGSSGKMSTNAARMAERLTLVFGIAGQVTDNSKAMVDLMEQTAMNFSNIASATEEMAATILDIAGSADNTRQITEEAVRQSEAAMAHMKGLADSAGAINQITEAIGDISEQINLLALNATIEAARAGEAGKGFAVVASEIKDLAVQTSGSAAQISSQVKEIQEATRGTAGKMKRISGVVSKANASVEEIAKAVDEQSIATTEVSRNIQEASDGVARASEMIRENDEGLARVSGDISDLENRSAIVRSGAGDVDQMAETLKRLANEMIALVEADQADRDKVKTDPAPGTGTAVSDAGKGVSSGLHSSAAAFSTP